MVEIKTDALTTDGAGVLVITAAPGGRDLGKYVHTLSFDPAGAPYSVELKVGGLWISGKAAVAAGQGVEIRTICEGIRVTASIAAAFNVNISTGCAPGGAQ